MTLTPRITLVYIYKMGPNFHAKTEEILKVCTNFFYISKQYKALRFSGFVSFCQILSRQQMLVFLVVNTMCPINHDRRKMTQRL